MSITLKKAGILATLQDLGTTGLQRFGINPGGAMDRAAVRLINTLLGNDENATVLEIHFPAAEIQFNDETVFALGGADLGATLDGSPIANWRLVKAPANSLLKFTSKTIGERCYISVPGGFNNSRIPTHLSRSEKVHKGDVIEFPACAIAAAATESHRFLSPSIIPRYSRFPTVRVIPGPEFDQLDESGQYDLTNENFLVSKDSNRMGYRLSGKPLARKEQTEMVSSPVTFGNIQLLPDGQLIILMADHQTAGGYPRIATVIERDLPLLAQLGANDKVAFHLVDLEHAEALANEFDRDLALLRIAVSFS